MTTSAPSSHLQESQKLTADALVDLFEVTLVGAPSPTIVRFHDGPQTIWQSATYESMACKLTGYQLNSDGSKSRPTLMIMNPAGIFNPFVFNGYLDSAQVVRKRVLGKHIEDNVNIYQPTFWYVARVRELISGQGITLELRSLTDGPDMLIPARKFLPSEGFPFVTL